MKVALEVMKRLFRDNELMIDMRFVWGFHVVVAIVLVCIWW